MSRTPRVLALLAVACVVASLVGAVASPAGATTARSATTRLSEVSADLATLAPVLADKLAAAPRARFVELDGVAVAAALHAGRVDLELFSDLVVPMDGIGPPTVGADGTLTWSGTTEGGGYATLTMKGTQVWGDIAYLGQRYDIAPSSGTTHLVTHETRTFKPEIDHDVNDPAWVAGAQASSDVSAQVATPTVRVLTWYDTYAQSYFENNGITGSATGEIAATINEANAAYGRTGINLILQSAGIEFYSHTSSGQSGTELVNFRNLTAVRNRRDVVKADLVSLITSLDDACGRAYLPPPSGADPEAAYSVIEASCARDNLSFAHELGHNLGAGHGYTDGSGTFSYSNGYHDLANDFRTIMAYPTTPSTMRLAFFSSPHYLYNSHPIGSASQDNSRTLNELAPTIANYRDDPAGAPTAAPVSVAGTPGYLSVPVSWAKPPSNNGAQITSYTVTATPGGATCTTTSGLSCTVTGLAKLATYTFTVKANGGGGSSPASTSTAPIKTLRYSDVPVANQFWGDIEWMATAGITTGYPNGTFLPNDQVQRQAMAAFLYRYSFPSGPTPTCSSAPYTDVPVGAPFCGEIAWMKSQNITTGFPDGSFHPGEGVQRQAMAAFLYRFHGSLNGPSPTCSTAPYTDVPVGSTFCGEIAWMKATAITSGYPDGGFHGGSLVERQAMAAFLHRYSQL